MILDKGLNYGHHIKWAAEKAAKVTNKLAQIMPNVSGPKQARRKLLASVATLVALYGAPIWSSATKKATHAATLNRVSRVAAMRTISAYRTISGDAAGVIAGIPPMDLQAEERRRIKGQEEAAETKLSRKVKKEIRMQAKEETIRKWQER